MALNRDGPLSSQGKTWSDRDKVDLHLEIIGELGSGGTVLDGAKAFVDRRFAEAAVKAKVPKRVSENDRAAAVARAHRNHYQWREEVAAMSDEREIIRRGLAAIGMKVESLRFSDGELPDPNPFALRVPPQTRGRPKKPRT